MASTRYQKRDVKYTKGHGDSNEWCGKCKFFIPASACRVVIGLINFEGWCMKYLDKETGGKPK